MKTRRLLFATGALFCGMAFVPFSPGQIARAAENDGLFLGEPAGDPISDSERIDALKARIASLEQRILNLESRTGNATLRASDACGCAVQATDVCGQAAATTTTSRVVVRRYLVPLGTTVVPIVNSASALSVQGFGATGVAAGTSAFAAPATFAAPSAVTTLAAPVTTLAPPAACSPITPTAYGVPGSTYSNWGAYPTTIYRGVGAVYSNSYGGAALTTGSGVSFHRVQ
jgi:hypothetical protein